MATNAGNLTENFAIWKCSRISKWPNQLAWAQEHNSVASLCRVMTLQWACYRLHLQGREAGEELDLGVLGQQASVRKVPARVTSLLLFLAECGTIEGGAQNFCRGIKPIQTQPACPSCPECRVCLAPKPYSGVLFPCRWSEWTASVLTWD